MVKFILLFFIINLETVHTCNCPGKQVNFLTPGTSISITSPNYPDNYPNNCDCPYVFGTADPSGEVGYFNVTFSHLDLEEFVDYVLFSSGNQTSYQDGIQCSQPFDNNNQCDNTFQITGPWMSMLFYSDDMITESGFSVTITAIDMSNSIANLTTCPECQQSGWILETNDEIQLPTGPFGPKCKCNWKIVVPEGDEITIQPNGIFFGPLDSLQITDLMTNQIIVNCNSNVDCDQQFVVKSYRAMVEVTSIIGVLNGQIIVGADILPSPTPGSEQCFCPGSPVVFLPNSGSSITITSPNYPQTYPNSCNCSYEIGTGSGHDFNVLFTNLDLEKEYDYVVFMLGNDTNPANKIKYCDGQEHYCPSFTINNNNWFTLLFVSDNSAYYSGFSVTITVI